MSEVKNCYSIYDRVAGVYMPPFYANCDGEATRMVLDAALDEQTIIHRHGRDMDLYKVGQFANFKGFINIPDSPVFICTVSSLLPFAGGAAVGGPPPQAAERQNSDLEAVQDETGIPIPEEDKPPVKSPENPLKKEIHENA